MEIGPISGIRVLPAVKVPPADSDLSRVFDIENSAKPGDDTYSGSGKKSSGGQDDESEEIDQGGEESSGAPAPEDGSTGQVNFFA